MLKMVSRRFGSNIGRNIYRHCSKMTDANIYSKTVILPKTDFPLRNDGKARTEREVAVMELADFDGLYEWQRSQNREKSFVLHDGPPYANGEPHIGHAVNKILKDITNRHKLLSGYKIHFVPGWDCHGLPIELKALRDEGLGGHFLHDDHPLIVREKARELATKSAKLQKEAFRRWGVMANWNNIYMTYNQDYVEAQLRLFCDLYEKGYVFRDFMPVFWSYSTRTALAEAEVEYNDSHKSTAIYFKCKIRKLTNLNSDNLNVLIWTTTPWTIPCNQAICYSTGHRYCIVSSDNNITAFLIASERKEYLEHILSIPLRVLQEFEGVALKDASYIHPLTGAELPFLPGHHVTMDKGTGLVHLAPAHGQDDFLVALKHNLPLVCLVDEEAKYVDGLGNGLAGKFVLEEGNEAVLQLLGDCVLHREMFNHSYPYDWRSKQPVIIRASLQWFIDIAKMKENAIKCLQDVKTFPSMAKTMMISQLEKRPYWCISRQRVWGVPLPVFYKSETKDWIINRHIIEHLVTLLHKHGIDFWWSLPSHLLLPPETKKKAGLNCDTVYERGSDILDIWFDSGSSWFSTLKECNGTADVLMEGKDQIGAWFQSSLLTSVGSQNKAPYRTLYVHGFTLDKNGRKMSKSLGNVIDPATIVDGKMDVKTDSIYGADVLRWWVALNAFEYKDVLVGRRILKSSNDNVHKIRIVLRYLLGILYYFKPESNSIPHERLLPIDQYMLHLLQRYRRQIIHDYDTFSYAQVGETILNFITNEVSAFYLHLIKDRVYCEKMSSLKRCSALTVANNLLETLVLSIAPILPFLAEDVYLHHPLFSKTQQLVFQTTWGKEDSVWKSDSLACDIQKILELRHTLNKESTVKSINIRYTDVYLTASNGLLSCLQILQPSPSSTESSLCELFQVAKVTICRELPDYQLPTAYVVKGTLSNENEQAEDTGNQEWFSMVLSPSKKSLCPRCRRCCADDNGKMCERCQCVLNGA